MQVKEFWTQLGCRVPFWDGELQFHGKRVFSQQITGEAADLDPTLWSEEDPKPDINNQQLNYSSKCFCTSSRNYKENASISFSLKEYQCVNRWGLFAICKNIWQETFLSVWGQMDAISLQRKKTKKLKWKLKLCTRAFVVTCGALNQRGLSMMFLNRTESGGLWLILLNQIDEFYEVFK